MRSKLVQLYAPVKPYDNRMTAGCLRAEAARNGRYGHLTGTVGSSQARCKLGINHALFDSFVFDLNIFYQKTTMTCSEKIGSERNHKLI